MPISCSNIVCERVKRNCPHVYPFATRTLYWPFEDPADSEGSVEEQLATFRRVRDQIADRVRGFLLHGE